MEKQTSQENQHCALLDTSKPRAILAEAKRSLKSTNPETDFKPVERVFLATKRLYDGRMPGYLACAVEYHDYCHSIAVFAASSRLLDGCVLSGLSLGPRLGAEMLIAALLHDAGYIRLEGDDSGTGAQYTKVHVDRSAAFARREAAALGLTGESAERVARMILATDIARPWESLDFESEEERRGGEILAAADLLGQMADRAYLEKLLFLYYEFREAGIGGYDCAFDVLKKTASFYAATRARLDGPLGRVSGMSERHFSVRNGLAKDLYSEAIERQMAYLDRIIADDSCNFRKKLKRMDLAAIESRRPSPAPTRPLTREGHSAIT
jgi:hypothetical protein